MKYNVREVTVRDGDTAAVNAAVMTALDASSAVDELVVHVQLDDYVVHQHLKDSTWCTIAGRRLGFAESGHGCWFMRVREPMPPPVLTVHRLRHGHDTACGCVRLADVQACSSRLCHGALFLSLALGLPDADTWVAVSTAEGVVVSSAAVVLPVPDKDGVVIEALCSCVRGAGGVIMAAIAAWCRVCHIRYMYITPVNPAVEALYREVYGPALRCVSVSKNVFGTLSMEL